MQDLPSRLALCCWLSWLRSSELLDSKDRASQFICIKWNQKYRCSCLSWTVFVFICGCGSNQDFVILPRHHSSVQTNVNLDMIEQRLTDCDMVFYYRCNLILHRILNTLDLHKKFQEQCIFFYSVIVFCQGIAHAFSFSHPFSLKQSV